VTRRLILLIGGSLAFWSLLALPAHAIWGGAALAYSATALALCLIPAALTLVWANHAYTQPADRQLTMVLGGTGVRLLLVAGGGMALMQFVPYFREPQTPGFLTWLLAFYLFTLVLETVLSLAGRPAADGDTFPSAPARSAERVG
jgi:hypothetical protein